MGVAGAWTVSVMFHHLSPANHILGLAHRLCWVICVLSHTKRIEGIGLAFLRLGLGDRPSQTFLFIRPTPANLAAYERWSGSEIQSHTWLGDLVDEVTKVDLTAGNTMIIPTGWIHAVVRCSLASPWL